MIGIVVVTHGGLAQELVSATCRIVGEIPDVAAVTIGWGDDPGASHEAIKVALAQVGGADALILTDMFGGTPTNLSLPFLSEKVEIVTGVSLPMLIKATSLREGELREVARVIRDQGRGAICVASEVLETGKA
jgi:PTS system mannose-specific IIA component